MATLVSDLVTAALVDCGAFGRGMPPPAEAVNDGFRKLNMMIAQWRRKRWIVYRIQEVSIAATGALSYTVGPGGQLAMAVRPAYLSYAFQRQLVSGVANPVDYPLDVLRAREDYASIRLKKLGSFGNSIFYDPDYPLGVIYPWPVIPSPYQIFLGAPFPLGAYAALTDAVNLPEEYEGAIYYNLVVRFGAQYRVPQDPVMVALAKDGLNVLREGNTAIATLRMPAVLVPGRGKYNIYSDNN